MNFYFDTVYITSLTARSGDVQRSRNDIPVNESTCICIYLTYKYTNKEYLLHKLRVVQRVMFGMNSN